MLSSSSDLPQKGLQIRQDDKFFSRLLSKESSVHNHSFRVGVPSAVPFMWESQPGTPKYTFCETSLPPLTPPPSYFFKSDQKPIKKHSRSGLIGILFPRLIPKKVNNVSSSRSSLCLSSPSSSSSSSWSSCNSSKLVPVTPKTHGGKSRFLTPGSSVDSRAEDDESVNGSPTSTLCFGIHRANTSGHRGRHGW